MPNPLKLRSPADWFQTPPETGPRERLEQVLATARALLAVSGLAAIYVDPTEPSRYVEVAYGLLIGYAAYSLLILLLLRFRTGLVPRFILAIHGADLLWAAVICLFTAGPNSPFFLFFVFVLCAAAYRWRLLETVASAAIMVALLISEAGLLAYGPMAGVPDADYEVNRFIMRAAYLMILGFLLGYLAEEEKELRAENTASARLLARARVDLGLRATLQAVLDELLRIFVSRRALLVVEEAASARRFLWQAERKRESDEVLLHMKELEPSQPVVPLPPEGAAWYAERTGEDDATPAWSYVVLDEPGKRLGPPPGMEESLLPGQAPRVFLGAAFAFGQEFSGTLLLLDPGRRSDRGADLRFLQMLMRNVGPAVYNVYLVRRLRFRAGAMERARVARELHDGAIQSLIAVEMQVDVLRRKADVQPGSVSGELEHIQQLLRDEVMALRELMQQMKPVEIAPQKLLEFLADLVERFRRETGISATFVTDLEEVSLSPHVCRELARIVQEALVNVRKHSAASNAVVRFGRKDGIWKLVIDDDGRGFEFIGRFTQADLDSARKGPLVIKERVRSMGGELTIESTPGRGARLEITLSAGSHKDHA
jgi:signal transduction histidine kinase